MAANDPAIGLHFDVKVDGVEIGSFTACEGLAAEYELFEYQEGGENGYVHRIPGRLKHSPIKLTRPIHERMADSKTKELAVWFSEVRTALTKAEPGRTKRKTATITARDSRGTTLAQWNLVDVYPARWTGPSMSGDGNSVLKETLELAHNGFVA